MRRLISFLVLACALSPRLAAQSDRGRPVILLVHGRGMLDRDTAETRKLWFDGLMSGTKTITRDATITDRDVRLVWYADALHPRSTASCDYDRNDPRAKRDAVADPDLRSFVSAAQGILGLLSGLVADNESGNELRALTADASFLGDVRKRCASERRLADAIERARGEGRPVIIVAHSLGSLVAYDYLSTRSDPGVVQQLVTIGSMVGSPVLRRLLIGGDSTEVFARPVSVKAWINIRNEHDAFAGPVSIVRDIVTNPPPDEIDPHEMVGYLRGNVTAATVLSGWCAAFSSRKPMGCEAVKP